MISEILFRGRSLETGDWVEGDLFNNYDGRKFIGELIVNDYAVNAYDDYELGVGFYEVNPETVGQWTGLVDKNGVKIFEGDVVRYKQVSRFPSRIRDLDEYIKGDMGEYAFIHEWTGVVTYKNGEFTPRPYICACEDFYYSFGYCDFEVIDNFWDNPELGGK